MAIPVHTSKLMHCQPQACESTNIERKVVLLHHNHMQWNPFTSYKNNVVRSKKTKNRYIGYHHIHINTDAFKEQTTKSVVSLEKVYKIL